MFVKEKNSQSKNNNLNLAKSTAKKYTVATRSLGDNSKISSLDRKNTPLEHSGSPLCSSEERKSTKIEKPLQEEKSVKIFSFQKKEVPTDKEQQYELKKMLGISQKDFVEEFTRQDNKIYSEQTSKEKFVIKKTDELVDTGTIRKLNIAKYNSFNNQHKYRHLTDSAKSKFNSDAAEKLISKKKAVFAYKNRFKQINLDKRNNDNRNLFEYKKENNKVYDHFGKQALEYTAFTLKSAERMRKSYDKDDNLSETVENVAKEPLKIAKDMAYRNLRKKVKSKFFSDDKGNMISSLKKNQQTSFAGRSKKTYQISKAQSVAKSAARDKAVKEYAIAQARAVAAKATASKAAKAAAAKAIAASANTASGGTIFLLGGGIVLLVILLVVVFVMIIALMYPFNYRNKDGNIETVNDDKVIIEEYHKCIDELIDTTNNDIKKMMGTGGSGVGDEVIDGDRYQQYVKEYTQYMVDNFIYQATGIGTPPTEPNQDYYVDPTEIEGNGGEIGPIFEGYEWADDTEGTEVPKGELYDEMLATLAAYNDRQMEANNGKDIIYMDDKSVKEFYSRFEFWELTQTEKSWVCEGCRTKTVTVDVYDSQGNKTGTEDKEEKYCPGHYKIILKLTFNFDLDMVWKEIALDDKGKKYYKDILKEMQN